MNTISTNAKEFWTQKADITKVLYGAGLNADLIVKLANKANFKIDYFIDADENKNGHSFNSIPIFSPKSFAEKNFNQNIEIFITVRDIIGAIYSIEKNISNANIYIPITEGKIPSFNFALAPLRNKALKNRDFTLISNSCVAARTYRLLDLPFTSPTITVTIESEDYCKFCTNLKEYLAQELKYIKSEEWLLTDKYHVLCSLGDIKIKFICQYDFDIVKEKWGRRVKRINYNNLYFLWDIFHYPVSKDVLQQFLNIENSKKMIFFRNFYIPVQNSIYNLDMFSPENIIEKRFMLCDWLNGEVTY